MSDPLTDRGSAMGSIEEISARVRANHRTVEDMVVTVIREAIVSGVYAPGEKLRQEHLASVLGVSRIPIRSGLRQLEGEGLVINSPHRGAVVRSLDPEEIAEIYDLRVVLETYALRLAAQQASDQDIEELAALANSLDAGPEGFEWLEVREHFYNLLYSIPKRPRLADMIDRLRSEVGRYWLSLRVVDHEEAAHRVIVEAISAGESSRAEEWLAAHLTSVSEELQRRVADGTFGVTRVADPDGTS